MTMARKSETPKLSRAALDKLVAELMDQGLLIEAGWASMRAMAIPRDAPALQLINMRLAFFAGAQHLFASIMATLDPGDEPTVQDLTRLNKIDDELRRFLEEYTATLQTEGNA